MEFRLVFLPLLLVLFSGCAGYSETGWRNVFEKQQGEKIELTGYIGGAMPYPTQIFKEEEQKGYLLNAQFGKQTTGIPLILSKPISCDSNHVKIRGETTKRGVQPSGTDFIEMLDWMLIKVDSFECLP